jgi:hypothetical protein
VEGRDDDRLSKFLDMELTKHECISLWNEHMKRRVGQPKPTSQQEGIPLLETALLVATAVLNNVTTPSTPLRLLYTIDEDDHAHTFEPL